MSALGLLAAALLLIPAGIFGACLPIVRELGRPTRAASAMLCGALALTTEALILSLVGIEWTLPSLLIPLVAVSALAGWMLCRLPESPGPETAYPGFPPALIVLVASAHLVVMLVASSATAGGLASFLGVEAVADYPRPFPVTKELGGMVLGGTGWGGDPGSSVLWLLAGLPIVAALLAMNMPLRKAWMLAAIWYAAMAMSLALTYSGESAEAPLLVFETLGAIAV
ncbi:MAG: hypothetical protein NDJ92_07885, partial [Thermoanaerobaculia bacterium]|nr:hypothetical protein [Thermoanaerobaculia bacterium]